MFKLSKKYQEILEKALPIILNKAGLLIEGKAKEMAPIDLGMMRVSISYRIEGNSVLIGTDIPYATFMEFGRPPGKGPPISAIEGWAKRHGIDPFLVQRAIKRRGIPVGTVDNPLFTYGTYRPFLRPAAHRSVTRIKEIAIEEINKAIQEEKVK